MAIIKKPNLRNIPVKHKKSLFGPFGNKHKSVMIIAGFVGTVMIAMYPIFIYPYFNIEKYQKAQEINRKNIDRESVQPGNMRVWSDPFSPRDDVK